MLKAPSAGSVFIGLKSAGFAAPTVELLGSEIQQMLEENLERTLSANPYEQMGGYVKRMRGLKLYFKSENAKG